MKWNSEWEEKLLKFLQNNRDAIKVEIGEDFTVYYLKTLVDQNFIIDSVKQMYFNKQVDFQDYFLSISERIDEEEILKELYFGRAIAIYKEQFWSIVESRLKSGRSVESPSRETSLEGGLEAFVEDLETNVNLVRNLYRNPKLEGEIYLVGDKSNTALALLFDSELADKEVVNSIRDKLKNLDRHIVQAASQLQQVLIEGQWLIPRLLITERPDRVVQGLVKGEAVILLEGTPMALIAPAAFHDFVSAVDDHYMLPIPALFLVLLRYFAILISILFPASYVAFSAYNPEVYRVHLALSIAGSRSNVPYASFLEVLFMLLMMEFLIEASIRLPRNVGQAAATVGGLILGQAATQAQLVSNIMIIIVAAVAISNFVIPITSMGLVIRISKYIMLFLATIAGMYGMLIGTVIFVFYIFSLNSFSQPFFNPIGTDFRKLLSRLTRGNF